MASLALFQSFENENYIEEQNVRPIELYILLNLNSYYSPCKRYWGKQYNLYNKLYTVCNWRKKKDLRPIAKKGETVCSSELVNFLANEIKTVSVQVVNGVGKKTTIMYFK